MKKTPLILSIVAIVVSVAAIVLSFVCGNSKSNKVAADGEQVEAVAGDVVYVRLDYVLNNYDMAADLSSALDSKAQAIQDDLQKQGRKLESDAKSFENQYNKGLLTRSAAEQQQQSLMQREQDLNNLSQQKSVELQEESIVMNNQIMDAIQTFLTAFNEDHQFGAIIGVTDAANMVIFGNQALDITQAVVDGLNAEYIKTRNQK